LLPHPLVASINSFTDQSNVLYVYIASIIVGSMFGMDRAMMLGGFLRIVVPVAARWRRLSSDRPPERCWGWGCGRRGLHGRAAGDGRRGGRRGDPAVDRLCRLVGPQAGPLLAEILPAVMFGNLMAVLIAVE
jgi:Na+/citrate or Na+/malate symporter